MRSAQTLEHQQVERPSPAALRRFLSAEVILSLVLLAAFIWALTQLTAQQAFSADIFSPLLARGEDNSWAWMSYLFFLIPVLALLTVGLSLTRMDNRWLILATGALPLALLLLTLVRGGVPAFGLMGFGGVLIFFTALLLTIVALVRLPDVGAQVTLLTLTAIVVFPMLWIGGMALDPRDLPGSDTILPPELSLRGFERLFNEPLINEQPLWVGLKNSLIAAGGTAILATVLGTSAAYAFSRFRFPGRQAGMLGFIILLIMPSVTTLAPLFVLLNLVRFGEGTEAWVLRQEIPGLIIAYASSSLPFVIWNLKGYFDTVPKELEEAALIDGAGPLQAFFKVVAPLSLPAFAVVLLFAFMAGWSEYLLAVIFMNRAENYTLPIFLQGMVNQYGSAPWSDFAALSILMSLPVVALFFLLQKWIVSGLTVGGVKG